MNEDRCRDKYLVFMGSLKKNGYHVKDFDGNSYYDFISVQYEYCDGLEPKMLGWIHNNISIHISKHEVYIDEGHLEILKHEYPILLGIIQYQVGEFKEFVMAELPKYIENPYLRDDS